MNEGMGGAIRAAGLVAFAGLFLAGGVAHFVKTDAYLQIMPPALPWPRALVLISGAAEVALGAMLLARPTRVPAAWGLIALLVAVFPANLFMWRHAERFPRIPPALLLARLPLQGLLIAWAWAYTRRPATWARPSAMVMAMALALLAAGCGSPSLARLDKGSFARAVDGPDGPARIEFAASSEAVAAGTTFRVISDAEGSVDQVDRMVIVAPVDGKIAGLMRRRDLQPGGR